MPRLRGERKNVRHDPLFGRAQATHPDYNVPRAVSFEELRDIVNARRRDGASPFSIKNQLRAIVAAAGLTSAAAGALTLRAYQYVDQSFGKRPRGSDASTTGTDHPKLRRVEKPDALPSYESVAGSEDQFVEENTDRIGNILNAATTLQDDEEVMEEMVRQDKEDADMVQYLEQQRQHEEDVREFIIRADGQTESVDDLPSGAQEEHEPLEYNISTMPVRIDDDETMDGSHVDASEAPSPAVEGRAVSSRAVSGPAGAPGSRSMQVTPIAKIPPSYPFHQTTEAILELHGSISTMLIASPENKSLWIRMNTYVAPFSETIGSVAVAPSWDINYSGTWFNEAMGRYVISPGSTGALMETLYNRQLTTFQDPLFFTTLTTDHVPAGASYYNLHYNAYTVTKCEWTVKCEMPFHCMKANWKTNDSPTPTEVQAALIGNTTFEVQPFNNARGRIFTHYRMQGDSISAVNPPVDKSTLEMERWNNVYDNKITLPVNGTRVIRGTWYPGKVKHNPLNDDDVQVWSTTGAVPASSHLEHLVIQPKLAANTNTRSTTQYMVNLHVNVKYYVQFKERKTELQYPIINQTNPTGTAINTLVLQNNGSSRSYPV